jgi:hypothetical protein
MMAIVECGDSSTREFEATLALKKKKRARVRGRERERDGYNLLN